MTETAQAKTRIGPGWIVAICFGVAALEGYDIQAFGVAAPHMAPDLKLSSQQLGLAGGAAMMGLVAGAFLGGWLADRGGRRPVLAGAVALFGVFSVLTAFAQTYEMLFAARLATGIGFGGAMPNLIAIATEISPQNRRAATTTSMFCGLPAGGALVALLASGLGDSLDWRTIFLIGGALPLVLAPVIWVFLPETRPAHDPAMDRSLRRALFGGGRALATLLIWTIFALDLLITYLLLNWLPTLVVAKGWSASAGAAASLWMNVFSVVGALLLGALADRVGFRWPLVAVFSVLAVAMWGLAEARALGAVLAWASVAGFTVVGGLYVLYALAPAYYPPHMRAAGAGAAIAVGRFGSIAGPMIAGELRTIGFSADQVFLTMIPAVLAAAVAILALMTLARPHAD